MVKYTILEDIFAESDLVNTESLEMHGEKVTKLFTKMEQSRKKNTQRMLLQKKPRPTLWTIKQKRSKTKCQKQ